MKNKIEVVAKCNESRVRKCKPNEIVQQRLGYLVMTKIKKHSDYCVLPNKQFEKESRFEADIVKFMNWSKHVIDKD